MGTDAPAGDAHDAGGGGLPLLRARTWAIAFLLVAIVLAVVFSLTMADLFRAAYHL